jgi:branched-chain amino acid transport system permease protein
MTEEQATPPTPPADASAPAIGIDEWVSQVEERRHQDPWLVRQLRPLDRIPISVRVLAFVALAALVPHFARSDYIDQVAVNAALLALLALGLNVVVGFAGILDLGYIAFYGFGAYLFAELASPQLGHHWPSVPALITVTVATGLLGVILGLPSRRLFGDYLAIVTLFFGQLFVTLTTNLDRLHIPFHHGPLDLTGGPNGIVGIDALRILGEPFPTKTLFSVSDYYYLLLGVFAIVSIILYRLNASQTGRAWRALHDDALAAGQMTIPVFRLRLFAFAIGAGIAGLAGAIFASQQISVFPTNFDIPVLITVYAAVVLGGQGSMPGVVLGAIVVAVLPEVLRDPSKAETLFYVAVLIALVTLVRPWKRLVAVLAGVVVFGFVVHVIGDAVSSRATAGTANSGSVIGRAVEHWVLLPSNPTTIGNVCFVALIFALLGLTLVHNANLRAALLVPVLYLAAFVWENRLIQEPTATRLMLFGALLVLMMIARPQGLLGKPRVETV